MKLNLGCSDRSALGFLNVDRVPPADQIADLGLPWPWEASTIEEIVARDIFEHIPDWPRGLVAGMAPQSSYRIGDGFRNWSGRIHVMNESWRVLVPGGRLTIECPNASKGAGQWQDPTHVSPWCPNSLGYYEAGHACRERFGDAYGITARFKVLSVREWQYQYPSQDREPVWKFEAILEAVK